MIKSNLFLIVSEQDELVAYPVSIIYPMDTEGYQLINFVPLVDLKSKNPNTICVVHRVNLYRFGDNLKINDIEIAYNDNNALLISMCNMLLGPRFAYREIDDEIIKLEYEWFRQAFVTCVIGVVKVSNNQKSLYSVIYNTMRKMFSLFGITQVEAVEFVEVVDEIIEDVLDSNGMITLERLENYRDSEGEDTVISPFILDLSDDDAQFFANFS